MTLKTLVQLCYGRYEIFYTLKFLGFPHGSSLSRYTYFWPGFKGNRIFFYKNRPICIITVSLSILSYHPSYYTSHYNNLYYNKVVRCIFVCSEGSCSPLAFTGWLLIGPGKVYNYFRGEYHQPRKREKNTSPKNLFLLFFFLKLQLKVKRVDFLPPSSAPRGIWGFSRCLI